MTTYTYKTDAVSGELEARSIREAMDQLIAEEGLTEAAIADGAWAWIEPVDGSEERLTIGTQGN